MLKITVYIGKRWMIFQLLVDEPKRYSDGESEFFTLKRGVPCSVSFVSARISGFRRCFEETTTDVHISKNKDYLGKF